MKRIILAAAAAALGALASAATTGYMLRSTGGSLKAKSERGMEWAAALPFGSQLDVLSEEPVSATYYWSGGHSAAPMEFYRVKYQNKEYYVTAKECAIGDSPAVVTEDATLFTKARLSTFRNAYLEHGTICLLTGRQEKVNGIDFTEVTFYDDSLPGLRTRWVQSGKLSRDKGDIKAVQLVELASAQTDAGMKENFMKLALQQKTTAAVAAYVRDTNNKLFNIIDGSSTEETEGGYKVVYTQDGANVNLRDAPQNGEVLAQLSNGDRVLPINRTVETEKIEGLTDHWYYVISNDQGGWVFGGYLRAEGDLDEPDAPAE